MPRRSGATRPKGSASKNRGGALAAIVQAGPYVAPRRPVAPQRIATISKDEARFWADGIYDVYVPPRSDTMRPDPPPRP